MFTFDDNSISNSCNCISSKNHISEVKALSILCFSNLLDFPSKWFLAKNKSLGKVLGAKLNNVPYNSRSHWQTPLSDTAFPRNLIQELQPYQYKNGLHFSAFARCDVSRDSQVEKVKPDCNGHFEMGGNVMACRSNKLFKENWI